ncbi:hypothetical protein KCU78_g5265, partial [Aureobasidium melanogenum]
MADTSYKKILSVNKTRAGRELVSSSLELLRLSNTTSYELDDLPVQTPDVELKWTAKPRAISAALGHRLTSWTQQTLRSFRLLLFMALGPWKKKEEEPKIALYTGWVSVLTGLLVHVLPLSACIALIYLNATSFFLGTHVSTLAFQFLAKFLELLAQASLASAVFVYLRALYTDPQPVPFGALFAGLQITSISYLWSLEFAGVVASKDFKRTRKFLFLLFIPLSIVLAVGIGPSLAIALTPTLGTIHNGWTEVWLNATEEQLFPSYLEPTVLVYDPSISSGFVIYWNTDATGLLQWTNFEPSLDGNFTTISHQPAVTVNCTSAGWMDPTTVYIINADDRYVLQSKYLRSLNDTIGSNRTTNSFQWVFIDRNNSVVEWPSQSVPSVWVVIHNAGGNTGGFLGPFALCAIYAGYAHVDNTILFTTSTWYMRQKLVSSETQGPSGSNIAISAIALNQTLPKLSTLVDQGLPEVDTLTFLATSLAASMAQWPKQILEYPDDDTQWPTPGIIIASTQNQVSSVNNSFQWLGSSAEDHVFYPGSEYADAEGKYRLRMDVSSHGYSYQINQTSKVIAISVLVAYCVYIVTFNILMLTLNRVHSNAWDSISELTALAIMSRPDDKLRNTSAGIETVALFKLPMNIRANENNHLEIVFEDGSESSSSGIVEKNKKYN